MQLLSVTSILEDLDWEKRIESGRMDNAGFRQPETNINFYQVVEQENLIQYSLSNEERFGQTVEMEMDLESYYNNAWQTKSGGLHSKTGCISLWTRPTVIRLGMWLTWTEDR